MAEFYGQLMELFGEVPTETILRKIGTKIGDGDGEIRRLMGHMAFTALCASQDSEPLDRRRVEAILDVMMALGRFKGGDQRKEEA